MRPAFGARDERRLSTNSVQGAVQHVLVHGVLHWTFRGHRKSVGHGEKEHCRTESPEPGLAFTERPKLHVRQTVRRFLMKFAWTSRENIADIAEIISHTNFHRFVKHICKTQISTHLHVRVVR